MFLLGLHNAKSIAAIHPPEGQLPVLVLENLFREPLCG